jgi:hypothetical protein
MKAGMVLPEAGQQATRENIVQAAKQAEEEGFEMAPAKCSYATLQTVIVIFSRHLANLVI